MLRIFSMIPFIFAISHGSLCKDECVVIDLLNKNCNMWCNKTENPSCDSTCKVLDLLNVNCPVWCADIETAAKCLKKCNIIDIECFIGCVESIKTKFLDVNEII